MRKDAAGFFWDDTPPPKPPKAEKAKRIPPDPTWLDPSYLPGLEEARLFPVHVMSIAELSMAAANREELIVDVESYYNYFLVCFTSVQTGNVFYLEAIAGVSKLDCNLLLWILMNFVTIGFNSLSYDMPVLYIAADGAEPLVLWAATKQIIQEEMRGGDVVRQHRAKVLKCDHIDLIEVAPLQASLKTYAGRLHAPKMQDLPFAPGSTLSDDQITIVRWYCVNDITNTAFLRECLREHISLRVELSNEYKVDLRSKSDAQIAEAVISHELQRITGTRPQRPTITPGTAYRYRVPAFIEYRSPLMNWALQTVREALFVIDDNGSVIMPAEVEALKLDMNGSVYRMGIGGLHSSEKSTAHFTDKDYVLIDRDVESYYPRIILNQGLAPKHLGDPFLRVYRSIVERRVAAKRAKNKVVSDSLKIVINGSFGKLGSKWSILYAPDLMIQVTITGQLSLLMLIERLEYAGIHVVSGNTDGIVIKCPRNMQGLMNEVIAQWEKDTGFVTEETRYMALYSKDVNNYLAVKQAFDEQNKVWVERPDGTKGKGAYANPWASTKNMAERLHKNPTATICVEAVCDYLSKGIPLEQTIRNSSNIRKFISVRSVKGGAVKVWDRIPPPDHNTQTELLHLAGFTEIAADAWVAPGASDRSAMYGKDAYKVAVDMLSKPGRTEYIGKTVRWYYAKDVPGEIVYASNGNRVPRSHGAKPLMQLTGEFPSDVDFDWYITEARRILVDIAAIKDEEVS